MQGNIYISGEIGTETALLDVIRQVKSFKNLTDLMVVIDSPGGYVEEGDAIYDYLTSLKSTMRVSTFCKTAYSMAAKIFAVGDVRIVEDRDDALLIHFPWAETAGRATDFETAAKDLKVEEKKLADFYANFLHIDEETVARLLENETMISGKDAVKLGFATELRAPAKAVARLKDNNKPIKKEKMAKQKIKDFMKALKDFMKSEANYQDVTGAEIIFPSLDEGAKPSLGDKATVNDAPIADGSYEIPSLDGEVIVFKDGAVAEIQPPKAPEDAPAPASEAEVPVSLDEVVAEVTTKIEAKFEKEKKEKETELQSKVNLLAKKDEEIKKMQEEIKGLKSKIASPEMEIPDGNEKEKEDLSKLPRDVQILSQLNK